MDLILSVFITDKRWSFSAEFFPNRYDRLDVFKNTLKSYSVIKFDKISLFVTLDTNYESRREELREYCHELFGDGFILKEKRIEQREEWVPIVHGIEDGKMVWFCQYDDHPFIDFNTDLVYEGLRLLQNDESKYKGLEFSHWPEAIRKAGANPSEIVGNFIKIKANYIDTFYIWSKPVLEFLVLENIWDGSHLPKPYMFDTLPFRPPMMPIYVPLRELCRHFDGYIHVGIRLEPDSQFPRLELPMQKLSFTEDHLLWRFKVPCGGYESDKPSYIQPEWEQKMINLYKPFIS
jgi:hypothetical protein